MSAGPIDDAALFDVDAPPPVSLADRFVMPPFSILDSRNGEWQQRKRRWLALGIRSEVGRAEGLTYARGGGTDDVSLKLRSISAGMSIFDPVVCELVYRWFSRPGATVLDPFCGGSVRGVVASILGRWYEGVDIRPEQVAANTAQGWLCSGMRPMWYVGDATNLSATFTPGHQFDLVFSCPPYADLERYSDDPRDISTWQYPDFVDGHRKAIADACAMLRPNRYAVWVVGDVRDPRGVYRGLHHETVAAFKSAGLAVLNECVIVDSLATAAIRAARPFEANRKLTLTHQHLLVFVKGDVRAAADWVSDAGDTEPTAWPGTAVPVQESEPEWCDPFDEVSA